MAKKIWHTEEQICDEIEKTIIARGSLDESGYGDTDLFCKGSMFRELEIAYGLRPDFTFYEFSAGKHKYDIVEVKINATMESIEQLTNYLWVCEKHVRHGWRHLAFQVNYRFHGHLIAKTFDRYVYSLAAKLWIRLWRVCWENDRFYVLEEVHPHEDSPADEKFVIMLAGGDPRLSLEGDKHGQEVNRFR